MPRSPYEPTPLNPAPDRAIWAAYEKQSRRATTEYYNRARRAAYPACAGECGGAVYTDGTTCWACREYERRGRR